MHTTRTLGGAATFALAAAFALGTSLPASAQAQPDIQGVTPADQTGGVAPQTLPDDDTVLPPGMQAGQEGMQPAEAAPRQVVVLPDGSRVDAAEGEFVDEADGSRVWVYQGQRYPVMTGQAGMAPGMPDQQEADQAEMAPGVIDEDLAGTPEQAPGVAPDAAVD